MNKGLLARSLTAVGQSDNGVPDVKVSRQKDNGHTAVAEGEHESLLVKTEQTNGTLKTPTLNIELESGMPSLKDMDSRDRFETED